MKKLKQAFNLMQQKCLLVKENFSCCSTCGRHEIQEERKELHLGYCFYNQQDARDKKNSGEFCLTYGAFKDHTVADTVGVSDLIVGLIITHCLRKAGVPHEWDENTQSRIFIRMGRTNG